MNSHRRLLRLATATFTPLLLAACGVTVHERDEGRSADVEVSTPLGAVSVQTNVGTTATGLPVYPGSRLKRDNDNDSGSADVDIRAFSMELKVVAAQFDGDAEPEAIVGFYKEAMATYGTVTECRGRIDVNRWKRARRPPCKERPWSDETQLIVGAEDRYRLVVVKPRTAGSEFAVVYIHTRS
jgi:hypothetical protein